MKTCPTCLRPIPEPIDTNPCKDCQVGWSEYSIDKDGNSVAKHCHDTCETLKNYMEESASNARDAYGGYREDE